MAKFRKKPIVIEAVQWLDTTESFNKIQELNLNGERTIISVGGDISPARLSIPTLEGDMIASVNDWIIKGVSGEIYPCKPDIFDKTYELVEDTEPLSLFKKDDRIKTEGKSYQCILCNNNIAVFGELTKIADGSSVSYEKTFIVSQERDANFIYMRIN